MLKTVEKEPDRLQFNITNGVDQEVAGCVYKLYCGNKYIIVKGKTLAGSVFLLEKGYAYWYAFKHDEFAYKKGDRKLDYFFIFYNYIKNHKQHSFQIEVLFESDNGYQLLKREQLELDEALSDRKCLNNNLIAYIPKWILPGHKRAFKKFLKNK